MIKATYEGRGKDDYSVVFINDNKLGDKNIIYINDYSGFLREGQTRIILEPYNSDGTGVGGQYIAWITLDRRCEMTILIEQGKVIRKKSIVITEKQWLSPSKELLCKKAAIELYIALRGRDEIK